MACLCFVNGCAIHYFDADTATEHIWGIGHMEMKAAAARDDVRAVMSGVDLLGASVGRGRDGFSMMVGWERQRHVDVVGRDAELTLEWPTSSFVDLRVGSQFPYTALTPEEPASGEVRP
jgi:hypothetical protein